MLFFADEMDVTLKGNTDTTFSDSDVVAIDTPSYAKKRTYEVMEKMSTTAQDIVNEMKVTNKLAKQSQLISLAHHLGKKNLLEQLLASVGSSCDD